jgi:hypothetical protein
MTCPFFRIRLPAALCGNIVPAIAVTTSGYPIPNISVVSRVKRMEVRQTECVTAAV